MGGNVEIISKGYIWWFNLLEDTCSTVAKMSHKNRPLGTGHDKEKML